MGYRTFFSVLTIAAAGGLTYAAFATKADVKQIVEEHTNDATPHHATISVIQADVIEAKSASKEASRVAGEAKDDTRYIRGRIDFLIENEMEQVRDKPRSLSRARRAASRVRKQSGAAEGSAEDPLAGVDGL